jgi:hypothetical protein
MKHIPEQPVDAFNLVLLQLVVPVLPWQNLDNPINFAQNSFDRPVIVKQPFATVSMCSATNYMDFVITESRKLGQFVRSIMDTNIELVADRGSSVVLTRSMAFGTNIG